MKERRAPLQRLAVVSLVIVIMMMIAVACGSDDDVDDGDGASTATTQQSAAGSTATGGSDEPKTEPTEAETQSSPTPPTTATSPTAPAGSPSAGGNALPTGLEGDLTVFAAASLTDAFEEMQAILEDANLDLSITYNFAGSQRLVTQLVEGADADVFASANAAQMTAAQDGDTIDGDPVVFVRNRLAIIVPSDNPGDVQTPDDLAVEGLKIVVANEDVPVGGYTLEALDLMSADPAFGDDFRDRVEANFVSLEDNVRQVVTKVQLGEADAGVVYVSDVTPDVRQDVTIVEIPEEFNVIAQYPVAPVTGGDSELAQAFIDFLLSPDGQAILEEWGFTPAED